MPHRARRLLPLAALALAATLAWTLTATEASDGLQKGKVALKSIGSLEFGPPGILFVGDSEGAAVWALDVGAGKASDAEHERETNLDGRIAALLGTDAREIAIRDMAVQPGSGVVYISATRGEGDAAKPVLLKMAPGGEPSLVPLDGMRHAKLSLDNAPAMDAKRRNLRLRTLTITDLEFIDGELFVAGLSNEEFASTLRRAAWPFDGSTKTTGLEVYHGAHGTYETHAPIRTFLPYKLGGKEHLVASYLCTPLVTFALDEVRSEQTLRGKTIAELGWGNVPLDIVSYEYEGEGYFLITNSRRGSMKIKASDVEKAQKEPGITTEIPHIGGVPYTSAPLGHVVQIDDLDQDRILILERTADTGSLQLSPRPKRWI